MTVSARWASPLCGSVPKAPRVALGRTRRASKPNPMRIHKKIAQKDGSFIDGGGLGIDVIAVASRGHTLAGDSRHTFRRQNSALGNVSRTHGVLTQPQITDTKKAPQGVLSFVWRWARDSNPGNLSVQRFSRPPLSTTQPAHLNLSRLLSREAPHYSDASLTIKLPVRYFPRNLCPPQLPSLGGLGGRLQLAQGYWRFSSRLGTRPS